MKITIEGLEVEQLLIIANALETKKRLFTDEQRAENDKLLRAAPETAREYIQGSSPALVTTDNVETAPPAVFDRSPEPVQAPAPAPAPAASEVWGNAQQPQPWHPVPAQPVASTQVELDAAGMPWDERIHSSAKSKVKDGTWKLRRGVEEHEVQEVKAEYRGGVPEKQPAPVEHVAPTATPTPMPNIVTREQITVRITQGMAAGKFMPQQVQQLLSANGITEMSQLAFSPNKFDAIMQGLIELEGGANG
jgi:hypothetical protein